jgi:hypothetical protein
MQEVQERHWREAAEFVARHKDIDEAILVVEAITELLEKASRAQPDSVH